MIPRPLAPGEMYRYPSWQDVENYKKTLLPAGQVSSLILPDDLSANPLARLNAENFGHQDQRHIGGVPGRIGGCTAKIRYAFEGEKSRQLWSWRGLIIVHDNRRQLEWLLAGDAHSVLLPRDIEPEHTIWIKDHPDFQSVAWPVLETDFKEERF